MMTPKKEKFIRGLVKGLSLSDAYREAYNCTNMKMETINNNAYKLYHDNEIVTRYNELLEEETNKAMLTYEEKRKMLKEIIEDKDNALNDRLKAFDIDNKMSGTYIQKIEADIDSEININLTD